jgi:hypothetical protein
MPREISAFADDDDAIDPLQQAIREDRMQDLPEAH